MNTLASRFKALRLSAPTFHIVLGSGFKDAVTGGGLPIGFSVKADFAFHEVEGMHTSTAPGHPGRFVVIEHHRTGKTGLIQVGRLHGYEGIEPREVIKPLMLTRELGTSLYFLTNAAGGVDPKYATGDVMLIQDQINLTGKSAVYGKNPARADGSEWGPRFPDLTNLFDRGWNDRLKMNYANEGLKVHEGVYIGVSGPAFETPAEIRFFHKIGAHAVGMSTVWETVAMKHTGATVVGTSLISNPGAGLNGNVELDHFAILEACRVSSIKILKGILVSVEPALE